MATSSEKSQLQALNPPLASSSLAAKQGTGTPRGDAPEFFNTEDVTTPGKNSEPFDYKSALEMVSQFHLKSIDSIPFSVAELRLDRFYSVADTTENIVFYAGERLDRGSTCWRGMQRRYVLYFFTKNGELVFYTHRRRPDCCVFGLTKEAIKHWFTETESNPKDMALIKCYWQSGDLLGVIRDEGTCCHAKYTMAEVNGKQIETSLLQFANFCSMLQCQNKCFWIIDHHGKSVGQFRQNMDPLKEMWGRQDRYFGAEFPKELSPGTKLIVAATAMEINISHFEHRWAWRSFVYLLMWSSVAFIIMGLVTLNSFVYKDEDK